jgi:hypothetical protein
MVSSIIDSVIILSITLVTFPLSLGIVLQLFQRLNIIKIKDMSYKKLFKATIVFLLMYFGLSLLIAFLILGLTAINSILHIRDDFSTILIVGVPIVVLIVLSVYAYHLILRKYFNTKMPINLYIWFFNIVSWSILALIIRVIVDLIFSIIY